MTDLQKSIKERRAETGQTMEQAAREIGCTLSAFSLWEAGKRQPKGLYAKALNEWLEGDE